MVQKLTNLLKEFSNRRGLVGYLFILPLISTLTIFALIPVGTSLVLSFHKWDIISSPRFIGLQNYVRLVDQELFWISLKNTFIYTVATVMIGLGLALGLALLLNEKWFRAKTFFRTVYFIPVVTSMVAVSMIWSWLYAPTYGLLNYVLKILGLPMQSWLSDPKLAMTCIIVMSVWKFLGYHTIIFLAGLQSIPDQMYEAAMLDGSNWWQRFGYITLPLLKPTTLFLTVMAIIGSFQVFDQVYIMTGGGPLYSTMVFIVYVYNNAFRYFRMGFGCTIAWILFGIILIVTLVQLRLFRETIEW